MTIHIQLFYHKMEAIRKYTEKENIPNMAIHVDISPPYLD
jgi:hypothetical protein